MDIKVLVAITNSIISKWDVDKCWEVNERTVRYWENPLGILEITKKGSRKEYTDEHVKRLLAIRLLQLKRGLPLTKMKDENTDEILMAFGLNPNAISKIVAEKGTVPVLREEAEVTETLEEKTMPQNDKAGIEQPVDSAAVELKVRDHQEYTNLQKYIRLGSAFVFADKMDEAIGKRLFALINGQSKKPAAISREIIYVDELDGYELPGCTASVNRLSAKPCLVVPDKDVYQENDVARLFVFDPSAAGEPITLDVFLAGVTLDKLDVILDENGCGLARFPTLVVGSYEIRYHNQPMCSFDAAGYELAPMVVGIESVQRAVTGKLVVNLTAESFGCPFNGTARLDLVENNRSKAHQSKKFEDGKAVVEFDASETEGALSIRATSAANPKLVASTPIPGSKREERREDVISSLGRVRTVSLIGSGASVRGLYVEDGACFNTPVSLASCVSNNVDLSINEPVENLVVALRGPDLSKPADIRRFDNMANGTALVNFTDPFVLVHVACFVKGKPWEGSAVVIRPSGNNVSIKHDAKLEPGQRLKLHVSSFFNLSNGYITLPSTKTASVLVKVSDRRVRATYEPMVAMASSFKKWMMEALSKRHVGFITKKAPDPVHMYDGILRSRSMFSPIVLQGMTADDAQITSSVSYDSQWRSASMSTPKYAKKYMSSPQLLARAPSGEEQVMSLNEGLPASNYYVASATPLPEGEWTLTSQSILAKAANIEKEQRPRGIDSDVIFCDLVKVNGEKDIEITLPDGIGTYDVRAFSVCGSDWAEHRSDLRVEKDMYIEPLIPRVAHPDDDVMCRAVIINVKDLLDVIVSVTVNGEEVDDQVSIVGKNAHVKWKAMSGIHEVKVKTTPSASFKCSDSIIRVVEEPGEEVVLSQEMRILKAGEKYDLSEDNALAVSVLPGLDGELKAVTHVCSDFSHSCCEQTSAKIVAAAVAYGRASGSGDDQEKDKAAQALINGHARLKSMHTPRGFCYYPNQDVSEWASKTAAYRLRNINNLMNEMAGGSLEAPTGVRKALEGIQEMAADVAKHGLDNTAGTMENLYHRKQGNIISQDDVKNLLAMFEKHGVYTMKAEAAYGAAALLAAGRLDLGIEVANAISKAMGSSMGGGMSGTQDLLAYVYLMKELRTAGVVPGSGGWVMVDGKEMMVAEALKVKDPQVVKAIKGSAVALRILRLSKIDLSKSNSSLPISIELKGESSKTVKHSGGALSMIKAGMPATLTVKLKDGYKAGDVLTVSLPDCLSRMLGGAKVKKFQADFAGKDEISVDLVAHEETKKAQHWGVAVRNMYDANRIGSVGLMKVDVE